MQAIAYEPCMLGFWNFIYGFHMEKKLTRIFFLVRVISLSGIKTCRQDILKSFWAMGLKLGQLIGDIE